MVAFTALYFQVTFVFTNQVNGRLVPVESIMSPKLQQKDPKKELLKSKQNGKQRQRRRKKAKRNEEERKEMELVKNGRAMQQHMTPVSNLRKRRHVQ